MLKHGYLLLFALCYVCFFYTLSFAQTEDASEPTIEHVRATTAVNAHINDTRRKVNEATQRETAARNRKNAARAEADGTQRALQVAEREYADALAALRTSSQSQVARRGVDLAQQRLEEATRNHTAKEAQAKNAEDAHRSAETELRRERALLDELRARLTKLESGEITPEQVISQTPARFVPQAEAVETIETVTAASIDDGAEQTNIVAIPEPPAPMTEKTRTSRERTLLTVRYSGAGLAAVGLVGGLIVNGNVNSEYDNYRAAGDFDAADRARKNTESHITTRNVLYTLGIIGAAGFTVTFFF